MRGKPMWMALYVGGGLVVLALLALVAGALTQVENWGRDFTTNSAATDEQVSDERLHPIRSEQSVTELAAAAVAAASKLPGWELIEETESAGNVELHFVRTTRLWRFKDDIRVHIEPADGGGSLLTAESRSRVGKGDLGQNPRNLRELLAAIRQTMP